jgi:hypothetical protein
MRLGCLGARWGARRAALRAHRERAAGLLRRALGREACGASRAPGRAAYGVFRDFWVVLFPGGLRMMSRRRLRTASFGRAAHGVFSEKLDCGCGQRGSLCVVGVLHY